MTASVVTVMTMMKRFLDLLLIARNPFPGREISHVKDIGVLSVRPETKKNSLDEREGA